jgi:predicted nucleic acid-binding protein
MIWLDSSFVVEWLLGTERVRGVPLDASSLAILPAQFAEVCVFFLRRDPRFTAEVLQTLELVAAEPDEMIDAARLFLAARARRSKASLADALLAAVAGRRGGVVYSFDQDLRYLGLMERQECIWSSPATIE